MGVKGSGEFIKELLSVFEIKDFIDYQAIKQIFLTIEICAKRILWLLTYWLFYWKNYCIFVVYNLNFDNDNENKKITINIYQENVQKPIYRLFYKINDLRKKKYSIVG